MGQGTCKVDHTTAPERAHLQNTLRANRPGENFKQRSVLDPQFKWSANLPRLLNTGQTRAPRLASGTSPRSSRSAHAGGNDYLGWDRGVSTEVGARDYTLGATPHHRTHCPTDRPGRIRGSKGAQAAVRGSTAASTRLSRGVLCVCNGVAGEQSDPGPGFTNRKAQEARHRSAQRAERCRGGRCRRAIKLTRVAATDARGA